MSTVLDSIILGIPIGCVYALLAVGLVLTYKTSGVLNLAFGAQAFVSAAVFYDLRVRHEWPLVAAALVAVVLVRAAPRPAAGPGAVPTPAHRDPDRQAGDLARSARGHPGAGEALVRPGHGAQPPEPRSQRRRGVPLRRLLAERQRHRHHRAHRHRGDRSQPDVPLLRHRAPDALPSSRVPGWPS
ncbi:MAG: hypothetical protein U5R31_09715 [Acidimicrobiia bacterium]|nr:hypothetical protein [Acidimicrobiia bacterium]